LIGSIKVWQYANHGSPMTVYPMPTSNLYTITELPVVEVGSILNGIHVACINALRMRALGFFAIAPGIPPYEQGSQAKR